VAITRTACQLAGNVGCRRVQGVQAIRVEVHPYLTADAADPRDRPCPRYGQKGLADLVVDEPGQGLIIHARRGDGVGQDRGARQHILLDHRIAQVGGQVRAHAGDGIAHVVHCLLGRLFEQELDPDAGHAVPQGAPDVPDALHRGQRVFDLAGDLGFQLRWRRTWQGRRHGDRGHVHVGEVLDLHVRETHQPRAHHENEEQDDGNGVADGPR
jgi:hypothetical protein